MKAFLLEKSRGQIKSEFDSLRNQRNVMFTLLNTGYLRNHPYVTTAKGLDG